MRHEVQGENRVRGQVQAQIALSQQQWPQARAGLKDHLAKNPNDFEVRKILDDLDQLKPDAPAQLYPIASWLQQQKAPGLATPLMQILAREVKLREKLLPLYEKQIETHWPGLSKSLGLNPTTGRLALNLHQRPELKDLAPLRGIPLNQLLLTKAGIKDLSPLRGMPLDFLDLTGDIGIDNLEPLRGLPLRHLNLPCPPVRRSCPTPPSAPWGWLPGSLPPRKNQGKQRTGR